MPTHALAIDAGTTGITAMVFDAQRVQVGKAYAEFTQHYPRPGWVEHDPQEILAVAERVGAEALQVAGVAPRNVVIGIANQRETTVVWNRISGTPIHRAIVWQDRRTVAACESLSDHAELVKARTGLVLDAYFSATKIAWILDEVAGARDQAIRGELAFGTIDSWLAWCWTGRHVTDPTNASRTLLFDIHTDAWDAELAALFEVPTSLLPELVPSASVVGTIAGGLLEGATVASLVGDQQAALFGQSCHAAGTAKCTYGTGCFLLQHTGDRPITSRHGLLTTRAATSDGSRAYALEGSVFIGGAVIQWLRDGIKLIDSSAQINQRAAEATHADGVVIVPAFVGLGAPYWEPNARGAMFGLTQGTTRRHIAWAALESIALQTADLLDAMEQDSALGLDDLRVDGGAAQSDILMQMQADVSRRSVGRPEQLETTAWGAAWLAGIATELYDVAPDATKRVPFLPAANEADICLLKRRWLSALAATRAFSAGCQ